MAESEEVVRGRINAVVQSTRRTISRLPESLYVSFLQARVDHSQHTYNFDADKGTAVASAKCHPYQPSDAPETLQLTVSRCHGATVSPRHFLTCSPYQSSGVIVSITESVYAIGESG